MTSIQEQAIAEVDKQGVHFASEDEQIAPNQKLDPADTVRGQRDDLNPQNEQELQQLRTALKNNIQSSRMQHHAFEPVSLPGSQPASRVSRIAAGVHASAN